MQTVHNRCAVWQTTPTLAGPVPHLLDTKLPRRFKLRLVRQMMRNVKHVGGPNPASDDPLINPSSGNDDNVPADVTSNEPRNRLTFSRFPATKPTLKALKHFSIAAQMQPLRSTVCDNCSG